MKLGVSVGSMIQPAQPLNQWQREQESPSYWTDFKIKGLKMLLLSRYFSQSLRSHHRLPGF